MVSLLTWNMQRSTVPKENEDALFDVYEIRRSFLMYLVDKFDYVFIQETPHNLLGPNSSIGEAKIYANKFPDTQKDTNACRNVIISKNALTEVEDDFVSGHDKANRHPATFYVDKGGFNLYLSSFHATSNPNKSKVNSEDFQKHHDFSKKGKFVWVIGADFNFNFTKDPNSDIMQPDESTQQSGRILDGFSVMSNIKVVPTKVSRYTPNIAEIGFDCEFYTTSKPPYFHPYLGELHGFIAMAKRPSHKPKHHHNDPVGFKLSDHCPVMAEIAI